MGVKTIISKHYKNMVNRAVEKAGDMELPPEGWLCTTRKALGMSAAQLARRLGVTRAHVSKTEKGELSGSVTLRTLRSMAEGMGCRLVYAIVPDGNTVEGLMVTRAREKARREVEEARKHMALEGQLLSEAQMNFEIDRLQQDILKNPPPDFWDEED